MGGELWAGMNFMLPVSFISTTTMHICHISSVYNFLKERYVHILHCRDLYLVINHSFPNVAVLPRQENTHGSVGHLWL